MKKIALILSILFFVIISVIVSFYFVTNNSKKVNNIKGYNITSKYDSFYVNISNGDKIKNGYSISCRNFNGYEKMFYVKTSDDNFTLKCDIEIEKGEFQVAILDKNYNIVKIIEKSGEYKINAKKNNKYLVRIVGFKFSGTSKMSVIKPSDVKITYLN